jgi:hypothetical protein
MRRTLLALALCWPLAACAPSLLSFPHPSAKPAPAPAAAAPAACPGGLRAEVQPQPKLPEGAGFPAPVTAEEKQSVASYLEWLTGFAAWARNGWERAAGAKAFCDAPGK